MAAAKRIEELMENNEIFAQNFQKPPEMKMIRAIRQKHGDGILIRQFPWKKARTQSYDRINGLTSLPKVTCLDPRSVPEEFWGPHLGAGVIRNAGGRATSEVVRSVLVLRSLIGAKTLLVVHHTDCGMTHLSDGQITQEATERTPDAAKEIAALDFACFTAEEFEDTIKKDVITLRNTKALGGMDIYGYALDTFTGVVKKLDV